MLVHYTRRIMNKVWLSAIIGTYLIKKFEEKKPKPKIGSTVLVHGYQAKIVYGISS